jgi:hypothetical protein
MVLRAVPTGRLTTNGSLLTLLSSTQIRLKNKFKEERGLSPLLLFDLFLRVFPFTDLEPTVHRQRI